MEYKQSRFLKSNFMRVRIYLAYAFFEVTVFIIYKKNMNPSNQYLLGGNPSTVVNSTYDFPSA